MPKSAAESDSAALFGIKRAASRQRQMEWCAGTGGRQGKNTAVYPANTHAAELHLLAEYGMINH